MYKEGYIIVVRKWLKLRDMPCQENGNTEHSLDFVEKLTLSSHNNQNPHLWLHNVTNIFTMYDSQTYKNIFLQYVNRHDQNRIYL